MSQVHLTAGPLADVTRSVLGDAAFLFCDEVPEGAAPTEGKYAEARISFVAPTSGSIVLRVPWNIALEAAANLLGSEQDDPEVEADALSAVGELLNMISGSALSAWFGPNTQWTLGVPATSVKEGPLPSPAPRGDVAAYVIDEARIEVEAIEGGVGDDQGSHR